MKQVKCNYSYKRINFQKRSRLVIQERLFLVYIFLYFSLATASNISNIRDINRYFKNKRDTLKLNRTSFQFKQSLIIFTLKSFYLYRLSHERRGDISFIARETISYFVTSERSERGTKYDIVTRAIKLILPRLECDNLFITYLCLYLKQKSDYI